MGGVAPDQLEQVPVVQGGVGTCVTTGRMFARSLPAHRPAGQAQWLAPVPLPCGSLREVSAGTATSASVDLSLLEAGSYHPTPLWLLPKHVGTLAAEEHMSQVSRARVAWDSWDAL